MPHGKALNAREETESPHFPLIPSRSPASPTRYFLTRAYSLGWATLFCLLACVRAQDMTHLGFEEFQVGTLPSVVTHFTVFEPYISNDGAFEGQQYLTAYGAVSIETPNHDLFTQYDLHLFMQPPGPQQSAELKIAGQTISIPAFNSWQTFQGTLNSPTQSLDISLYYSGQAFALGYKLDAINVVTIPEPSTWVFLLAGSTALMLPLRRSLRFYPPCRQMSLVVFAALIIPTPAQETVTIDFTTMPTGLTLNEQFASQGIHFYSGNASSAIGTYPLPPFFLPPDRTLAASGYFGMRFDYPVTSVEATFGMPFIAGTQGGPYFQLYEFSNDGSSRQIGGASFPGNLFFSRGPFPLDPGFNLQVEFRGRRHPGELPDRPDALYFSSIRVTFVPEPSTWALLLTGSTALLLFGRRQNSAKSVPSAIP